MNGRRWNREQRQKEEQGGRTEEGSATKTVLERVKSRFDPPEQNQMDRETGRARGTGEGSGTKPVLERVKSRFDPPE